MTMYTYDPKRNASYTSKGVKMPPTESVPAKALKVGDIIFVTAESRSKYSSCKSVTVTAIERTKPDDRPKRLRSTVFLRLTTVDGKGRVEQQGLDYADETEPDGQLLVGPNQHFERQFASTEEAETKERQQTIMSWRSGVRTVVSRLETEIQSMKANGTSHIWEYREELERILPMLIAVDERMTRDGGSDPKTDVRKPVHPSGRRRG
jgi:hypothetical protein